MSTADEGRSLGTLVASATAELSALVHEEIALAKAELRQDVKRVAFGSIAATVALVLAFFAMPLFSFALAFWVRDWWDVPLAIACCVIGGLYLLLAVVLLLVAKTRFGGISPPRRSMESAKETAAVLSNVKPHPRSVTLAKAPDDTEHSLADSRV